MRAGRFARLWASRNVLGILVRRDLRVRYARSAIGYLWTVIDPLAMALIYFVIFTQVFQRDDVGHEPYFLFLLAGLLSWQWFNGAVNETSRALLAEAKLVRSTNLPRELWVIRVVIAKGVEYVLSLPVLVAFVVYYLAVGQTRLDWQIVLFPLGFVLQFVLCIGIGLLLAPATVIADDTIRVVRIALRMMFYGTPIIYSIDAAGEGWLQAILSLNPLTGVLELQRAGFFDEPLAVVPLVVSCVVSVVLLVVGTVVFGRMERTVLKEI
ncbi:MAG: ABC transporter permease [Dermatophilaceae bacterium]